MSGNSCSIATREPVMGLCWLQKLKTRTLLLKVDKGAKHSLTPKLKHGISLDYQLPPALLHAIKEEHKAVEHSREHVQL